MRIGFVTCHFPPDSVGGGQMQSLRLCEALSEKHEVTVFTRSYSKGLKIKERSGNYLLQRRRVISIPIIKSVVDLIKGLNQINAYKSQIDIYISFHVQLAALMVVLAKLLIGTKAIVSPPGLEDFDFKWYKRGFQLFIYKYADFILIQSEKIKQTFIENSFQHLSKKHQEKIIKKIRIFPNGIRVPNKCHSKLSDRQNQIIFIGRLEPIKGLITLLDALRIYNSNVHLLVIGDGSQRAYLEENANGLHVTFLGSCSEKDVYSNLKQSKLLVLPSRSENFPNVILEAFCAGVPVIASSVGAIPELITEGENGYLVAPADSNALAEKIKVILEDNESLDRMGELSYQSVDKYDWKRLINKFEGMFDVN